MIRQYQIKDYDTMQTIARSVYGDPARWTEIVAYNQLDYPFITADQAFEREIKASGLATFSVSSPAGSAINIPAGTTVSAKGSDRKYQVVFGGAINAGALSVDLRVDCIFAGGWGNAGAETIDTMDTVISGVSVINVEAFTNGRIINVKKTGEYLLIPIDETTQATYLDADSFIKDIGGEDIAMDDRDDFMVDAQGDTASYAGLANIKQSLTDRWLTDKGDLPYHPEYGSNLSRLIGRVEPFIDKMIALELETTALQDPRIESLTVLGFTKSSGALQVEVDVQIIGQEKAQRLSLSLERS
jgi:phage baseplate assembly protein W